MLLRLSLALLLAPAVAEVAEAPWSGAEWAVALRFDNPRAIVVVLVLVETPLRVLGFPKVLNLFKDTPNGRKPSKYP